MCDDSEWDEQKKNKKTTTRRANVRDIEPIVAKLCGVVDGHRCCQQTLVVNARHGGQMEGNVRDIPKRR